MLYDSQATFSNNLFNSYLRFSLILRVLNRDNDLIERDDFFDLIIAVDWSTTWFKSSDTRFLFIINYFRCLKRLLCVNKLIWWIIDARRVVLMGDAFNLGSSPWIYATPVDGIKAGSCPPLFFAFSSHRFEVGAMVIWDLGISWNQHLASLLSRLFVPPGPQRSFAPIFKLGISSVLVLVQI